MHFGKVGGKPIDDSEGDLVSFFGRSYGGGGVSQLRRSGDSGGGIGRGRRRGRNIGSRSRFWFKFKSKFWFFKVVLLFVFSALSFSRFFVVFFGFLDDDVSDDVQAGVFLSVFGGSKVFQQGNQNGLLLCYVVGGGFTSFDHLIDDCVVNKQRKQSWDGGVVEMCFLKLNFVIVLF